MAHAGALARQAEARFGSLGLPFGTLHAEEKLFVVLTSHPIQYQSPLWRRIASTTALDFEVWYLTPHGFERNFDREFGQSFQWDIDLRGGFRNRFVEIEPNWDMTRFRGVRAKRPWAALLAEVNATHLWIEGWRFAEFWKAARVARKLGLQVWLRGETNDLSRRSGPKSLFRKVALRNYFSNFNHFFYIGTANKRFYQSLGVGPQKLSPAPYCVDNDWFFAESQASRTQRKALRKRWSVDDDAFCILFCGKFIIKKRPVDLIRAAARLGIPKMHLLFVGSGALQREIEQTHAEIRTGQGASAPELALSFTGFLNQTQIIDAYVAADCLALPSDAGETWGLVANEAMACGTPVVASDLCGCAEDLVAPCGREFVFRCGNIDEFARALSAMHRCPPSRDTVSGIVGLHHFDATVNSIVRQSGSKS